MVVTDPGSQSTDVPAPSTTRAATPIERFALGDIALLGCFALVAHGLLLLNDGIYWDDWLIYPQLVGGDWQSINALVQESGMTHVNAAFLDLFAFSPLGVFEVKLAVFVLIFAIACAVYAIALEAGLRRLEAWLVAALAIAFPGFQDWVLLVTASSVFDYALFLGATFLLLRAERADAHRRPWLQALAAVGFLLSFSLSSLLALYLASLFLLFLVCSRSIGIRELVRARWPYAAGLIALPVIFWTVSRALYQPNGLYLGANAFASRPGQVRTALEGFVLNGVADQVGQALAALLRPWTPLLVALVAALGWRFRRRPSIPRGRFTSALILVGLVAIGLAMLPYALVGKYPTVHGWDTRHDLLIGLPMGALLVAVIRFALPAGKAAWLGVVLVGVLAIGFAAAGIEDYAALQARWAVDQAVMAQLRSSNGDAGYSVYWVKDEVPGPEDFYRFYEWSAMFGKVYGGQTRVGLDTRFYGPTFLAQTAFFNDRYDLAGFDPKGCQADLVIAPGPSAASAERTALAYTFYRLFQPDQLGRYLDSIVTVQVTPHPSVDATDCRR